MEYSWPWAHSYGNEAIYEGTPCVFWASQEKWIRRAISQWEKEKNTFCSLSNLLKQVQNASNPLDKGLLLMHFDLRGFTHGEALERSQDQFDEWIYTSVILDNLFII